ncbi:MAG: S8 family serine peptidase [Candidatus Eisenbacteria bacterium]
MSRHNMIRAMLLSAVLMIAGHVPARAAWMWDVNGDKLDDRMQQVETGGISAARVGGLPGGRLRFALVEGSAPFRYGVYIGYDHHPTDSDAGALAATGAPVQVRYESIDYIRSEVTYAQAQAIVALSGVRRVETIPIFYAVNDNATRVMRARESAAHFPSVWKDLGFTGRGVVVAIMDTGVNDAADGSYPGHESLRGKWLGGGNFFSGQPQLNTPLESSENPRHASDPELTYHGTHVAGTAIGSGGPQGVRGSTAPGTFAGMAPDARLVDLKVLSDAGLGFGAADGIDWAIHHRFDTWGLTGEDASYKGIDVLSMSLGGTDNSDGTDASCAAVNAAHRAGMVVCVATGNDGNTNWMASPSAADFALSVGAFTDNNTLNRNDDFVSDYSNEGPRLADGDETRYDEMKPSVLGDGTGIISALGDPTTNGDRYHHINGTSMATPTVAGVCALILSANPGLSPDQVRQVIQNSADHRTDSGKQPPSAADPFGLDPNYHPSWGWGEVDAYAAVKEAQNAATTQVVRISATAQRAPDAIRIDWTSQREVDLFRYEVERAVDAGGAPGEFETVANVLPSGSNAEILGRSNRHPYSWTDNGPGLDPAQVYWYRVGWRDFHNVHHSEPPLRARISDSPIVARVKFSWTHNYSDGDLVVKYGSAVNPDRPAWMRYAPGAPAADSVKSVAGVSFSGTKRYFFHFDLTAADLVTQYLPPSAANPWFLSVREGGYVNTNGKVDDFSVTVFDGVTSTVYASPQTTTPTVEKQETVFWVPLDPATSPDHSPVLEAIGPRKVAEGLRLQFIARASDPDGDATNLSATNLPIGATFNTSTGEFSWTPGYSQAGSYTVSFGCSSGQPLPKSDSEAVTITVSERAPGSNLPPAFDPIGDHEGQTGQILSFQVTARDPESQAVTFSVSGALPANSSFDGATGVFSWTPAVSQVGTQQLNFIATDPQGAADEEGVVLTISEAGVGPAPVLPCDATQFRHEGIAGPGTDPGDKSISYFGFDVNSNIQRIQGALSFSLAPVRDLDFYLLDADSNVVQSSASISMPEVITYSTPSAGHYIWKVVSFTNPDTAHISIDQTTCLARAAGVESTTPGLSFSPASPNPASRQTMLAFALPEPGNVTMRVHDVAGRAVRMLYSGWTAAGSHRVSWDRRDDHGVRMSAGLYFVRLEAAGLQLGQKVILIQ